MTVPVDEDGELKRRVSCVDLRDSMKGELAFDIDELREQDEDLADLVEELLSGYANVWVSVYDVDDWHLGVFDRSATDVQAGTLQRLIWEGLYVIHAGQQQLDYENGEQYPHAYVEVKRHSGDLHEHIREFYDRR